jgi:hypothetical protein
LLELLLYVGQPSQPILPPVPLHLPSPGQDPTGGGESGRVASLVLSRLTGPARSIPEIDSPLGCEVEVDGEARGSVIGLGLSLDREGNIIVPLGVNAAPIGGNEIPEEDRASRSPFPFPFP